MAKKRIVMALGHNALGTSLPEQKTAVAGTAKVIAGFIQNGWQVSVTHGNAPQVGMIHTAMNEFSRRHAGYTAAPMSVCSAMSQGYIGYDLQNGIRSELVQRGILNLPPCCPRLTPPFLLSKRGRGAGPLLPPWKKRKTASKGGPGL